MDSDTRYWGAACKEWVGRYKFWRDTLSEHNRHPRGLHSHIFAYLNHARGALIFAIRKTEKQLGRKPRKFR